MSNLLKNLTIALGITVLLGVVYYFTLGQETDTLPEDDTAIVGGEQSAAVLITEEILSNTQKIDELELNTSIFKDKRFTTLKNFRVDIDDVDTGRENPFAPVE